MIFSISTSSSVSPKWFLVMISARDMLNFNKNALIPTPFGMVFKNKGVCIFLSDLANGSCLLAQPKPLFQEGFFTFLGINRYFLTKNEVAA